MVDKQRDDGFVLWQKRPKNEFRDLSTQGVIDPAKVVRAAFRYAAPVSGLCAKPSDDCGTPRGRNNAGASN